MDGRGWAEQPGGFEPNGEWTADAGDALDTGLRELSRRLDELMVSVERLGAEGHWIQPTQPAAHEPEPLVASWGTYAPPAPIEPAAWEQPFEPPPQSWAPEIMPTSTSMPLIEVATLDAGPFVDLIELRHFEEDLGELARVRDVRVRRFGHHRANIEVAVSSAPLLEHELQLLGREMSVGATPEGEVVVELVPQIVPVEDDAGEGTESRPLEDADA